MRDELLLDYMGSVLLLSHDRAFLDNVVTGTLVLEGGGRVGEYVGGFSDWLRYRQNVAAADARSKAGGAPAPVQEKRAVKSTLILLLLGDLQPLRGEVRRGT